MRELVVITQRSERMSIQSQLVAQDVDGDCSGKTIEDQHWRSEVLSKSEKAVEKQQQRAGVDGVHRPLSIRKADQQHRLGRKANDAERIEFNLPVSRPGVCGRHILHTNSPCPSEHTKNDVTAQGVRVPTFSFGCSGDWSSVSCSC